MRRMCGLCRARRDQRNEADIRAGADPLQHHVADTEGRFGTALLQRFAARIVKAGIREIAKTEHRTRGIAGGDEHAVARKRGDRRVDAFDQALQPLGQRHRAPDRLGGCNQNALAAIREIKPRAAAGSEHAGPCAEAAQPLHPDRAGRGQPPCKPRNLAPVCIRRTENLFGEGGAAGCAEQLCSDRIGPQNPCAVDRPEPCGKGACRMHRQSRIADASQLEFRVIHGGDMTALVLFARRWPQVSEAKQRQA